MDISEAAARLKHFEQGDLRRRIIDLETVCRGAAAQGVAESLADLEVSDDLLLSIPAERRRG